MPRAFYFADICKKSLYIIKADFCLKLIYETFISAPQSPYLKSSSVLLFSFFFWWNGAKVTEKWLHCQNFATNASFLGKICQQKKSAELTFVRRAFFPQLQCLPVKLASVLYDEWQGGNCASLSLGTLMTETQGASWWKQSRQSPFHILTEETWVAGTESSFPLLGGKTPPTGTGKQRLRPSSSLSTQGFREFIMCGNKHKV